MKTEITNTEGVLTIRAENQQLAFEIAPQLGGRITSIYHKALRKEFLWRNKDMPLAQNNLGADYDSNFWGGIDELLPNDIPETVDSVTYPDHGELWTMPLSYEITSDKISVEGTLPLSKLYYRKNISLNTNDPQIEIQYKIRNDSGVRRHFLWKLHAAVQIEEGNRMQSMAKRASNVSIGSSRYKTTKEFPWPFIENTDVSLVPAKNGTMDFFYLYDNSEATMQMLSANGEHVFAYHYDRNVFPYQWYFASYGQFKDHYTAILEPASSMPVSVNDAMKLDQCAVLEPGQEINTIVKIYAGPLEGMHLTGDTL